LDKGAVEIACDLCGSSDHTSEFEKDDYSAVRCSGCGLVFVNPQPCREYLEKEVYDEEYFDAGRGFGIEDALGKGAREARRRANALFRDIEKSMQPGRVLDVGCAAGYVLDTARRRGWDTTGVEISDFAATHAREELGLEVLTGDFPEMGLSTESFDLVLMLDVIEHFRSPRRALEKALDVAAPGGRLVLDTPNYDSAPARFLGTRWGLIAPEHHLFYFTPRTLSRMLRETGFKDIEIEFPQWGLSELLLSAGSFQKAGVPVSDEGKKLVRKYLRGPRDAARAAAGAIDKALLAPVFRNRKGSIIHVVARKAGS